MEIVDLATQPEHIREQAAALLVEHFDEPRDCPSLAMARAEVEHVIYNGFARAALDGEALLGWVGGLVRREDRRWGVGRALIAAFESEAASRRVLTITSAATMTRA